MTLTHTTQEVVLA